MAKVACSLSRHADSGYGAQSIDFETCEVYEVDDGVVIATWAYGDLGQLVRQISPQEDTI